jgi:hypothetical protein
LFKYDRDYLCVNKSQFFPAIFEPPCTNNHKNREGIYRSYEKKIFASTLGIIKVKQLLCFIKHYATKTYGEAAVELHRFLINSTLIGRGQLRTQVALCPVPTEWKAKVDPRVHLDALEGKKKTLGRGTRSLGRQAVGLISNRKRRHFMVTKEDNGDTRN